MAIAAGVAAGVGAGAGLLGGILSPIIQGEYNKDQAGLDREFQAAENQKNRAYNTFEAQRDREFQEHMRNTSFISAVNQAKELGISPSLLLGDQSNQLGGSKASTSGTGGSKASLSGIANPLSSVADTINKILDQQHQRELAEDRQAHQRELAEDRQAHQRELAEDRQAYLEKRDEKLFEHQKELAKIYNSNSVTSKQAQKHNYSKKELDNLFTPIDQVEI